MLRTGGLGGRRAGVDRNKGELQGGGNKRNGCRIASALPKNG